MLDEFIPPLEEVEVVYQEIDILTDLEGLTNDFMEKCGYSEEEAQLAAKNVLLQDDVFNY